MLRANAHRGLLTMGVMVVREVNFLSIQAGPTSLSGLARGRGPTHIGIALEAGEQMMTQCPHAPKEFAGGIGAVGEHVQTDPRGPAHRRQQIQRQPGLFAEIGGDAILRAQIERGPQREAQGAGDCRPHHPQRHPAMAEQEGPGALVFARVVMEVIGEAGDLLAGFGDHAVVNRGPDAKPALLIAGKGQGDQQQRPELVQQRGRAPVSSGTQARVNTLGLGIGAAAGDGRAGAPALAQHQRADIMAKRLGARFRKHRCKAGQHRSYDLGQNEGLGHGRRPRWQCLFINKHHLPLTAVGPLSFPTLLPLQNGRSIV